MSLKWRRLEEKIFLAITGLITVLVACMLIWIIGQIAWNGLSVIDLHFLTTQQVSDPIIGHVIGDAIVGTIILCLVSVILATPLSVATAIYIKRYAKDNYWTRSLSLLLDVLSGTPSIVLGMLGYLLLVYYCKSITGGFSLISGSIALAILIVPTIEKGAESAIDTVPTEFEHVSYALGSNLWQTITRITIPYALPGIITGVILGAGRACEETAVVVFTAGYSQYFPVFKVEQAPELLGGVRIFPLQWVVATLPATIYKDFDLSYIVPSTYMFAASFVLIVIVMLINLSAKAVMWRYRMGAKRTPLIPVMLTTGMRRVFWSPIIARVAPIMAGVDGAGNENKIGKAVRWFVTNPKKIAKEKEDTDISDNLQKTSSVSMVREHQIIGEKTVIDIGHPVQSTENVSPIYSTETTNKAIEAMDNSEAPMLESTSYPPESKHPPAVHEPAEEIRGENEKVEPVQEIIEPLEPLSVKETDETLKPNADGDEDEVGMFVMPLTTDPLKEATEKKESDSIIIEVPVESPTVLHKSSQPALPATHGLQGKVPNISEAQKNDSGLEIIPPVTALRKATSINNTDLVIYPGAYSPIVKEPEEASGLTDNKDQSKAGRLVKWFLTDPKKEAAKKKEITPIKAEALHAPVVQTVPTQEQSPQPFAQPGSVQKEQTAATHLASSSDSVEAEADLNRIYPPQSPPSLKEVSETLGKKEKKGGKAGGIVKWFLTDPKKKDAKADGTYGTDGGTVADNTGAKVKKSKVPVSLPKIFGMGSPKQKNVNEMLDFNVGKLAQPTLEGSIRDTDFTYAIDPPFQYVRIFFDGEELVYNVLEPVLSDAQKKFMAIIERGLEKMISSKIVAIKPEEREQFLREKFDEIIDLYGWNLNTEYRDRMFYFLRKRYLGYDRIDIIMKDHFIEDISCNGPNAYVYIFHRIYGSVRTNVSYGDVELNKFVMRMAQISGRHISILQPIKDISLPDGSRANLTLGTEVTKKGATFTIRKFKDRPISPIELLDYGSMDSRALAYLWTLLDYKRSILVSGGTASGKTTLMNALCTFIRPELKIVSLEDTPELNLVHPNWIQSVTRSGFGGESGGGAESVSGISGVSAKSPGNIGLYDLLVAALRQRPEYILVGEVRGAEAFTLFQAIAVGHACMGTIHAGNMRELLSRVESNPMNVPRTLFAAMDAVCFSAMVRKGDRNIRRVMQIVEILEIDTEGNLITNPVFRWDAVTDRFVFTGKSHIFEKIEIQLGVKQEALVREMDKRAALLQKLRNEGIRDYTTVVEYIREYELNKITGNN